MKRLTNTFPNPLTAMSFYTAILLSLGMSLPAKDTNTDNNTATVKQLRDQLDDTEKEIADEYLRILEKLDATVDDYTEYLDELDQYFLKENNLSLRSFDRKLQSNTYLDNPRELQDDIQKYISRLDRLTDHTHNRDCRESCRMLTNLKRELIVAGEHMNDYFSNRTRRLLRQKGMIEYLRANLARLINVRPDAPTAPDSPANVPNNQNGPATTTSTQNQTPTAPDSPAPLVRPDLEELTNTNRTFNTSLSSVSANRVIRVINPAGDLRITGWNKSVISASLQVEVASQRKESETVFLDNTSLLIDTLSGSYELSVNYPTLDNMNTRLTKSSLVIRVPFRNSLRARSSFGQISVADINANISITGHHSEINVDNSVGTTEIANSSGPVRLTDIEGEIFAKCSYGAIELTNCQGDMQIENTYSDIRMYDCGGTGALRGSGKVFIQGFTGALDISNSYGPVEVRDVDGTLEATNAYNTLIVRDISGSTSLENSYANITAYKIGGRLTISNSNGIIIAEGMEGPMNIENERGDIKIVLDGSMGGNSIITNQGGEIDVAFLRRGDFVLKASTVSGQINSHLPLYIEKDGNKKTTAITFGRGIDSILLVGTNTVINIVEDN